MSELFVGDVFEEDPLDVELAVPFVLLGPGIELLVDVYAVVHLSHAQELAAGIHAEKQLDWALVAVFAPGRHQLVVPVFGRGPDALLDGFVHVVFAVTLDYKHSGEIGNDEIVRIHGLEFRIAHSGHLSSALHLFRVNRLGVPLPGLMLAVATSPLGSSSATAAPVVLWLFIHHGIHP